MVPLLLAVLGPVPGERYLDLGCGEGLVMRAVGGTGAHVVGVDISAALLAHAAPVAPVVRGRLPDLGWLRPGRLDGAYAVLVLEHLPDPAGFFTETARVVRPGGVLAAVLNHPALTTPGAGPVVDSEDGEVYWRWGPYLEDGAGDEPAGDGMLTFYHRPLGRLLTAAADAGWRLERLEERGPGPSAAADSLLSRQLQIPRLLAARWGRG